MTKKISLTPYLRNFIWLWLLVHVCKMMISPAFCFFYFFKILIFQFFQSSSINAKRKFWDVPYILAICVIFRNSMAWSCFHFSFGHYFFAHTKKFYTVFQVWLFKFTTILKTCFENLFRKTEKKMVILLLWINHLNCTGYLKAYAFTLQHIYISFPMKCSCFVSIFI